MNEDQKQTLMKWRSRCKRAQIAHSYTAISYGRYHLFLGIMLIALTTTSCVLIFAPNTIMPSWLSPTIGISAALFAYLQTFLRLSEQADSQRVVARRYGALKKEIEYILDFQLNATNCMDQVDSVRVKEYEIATDAPHALSHRWKKAANETKSENDFFSRRNRP
ncbi:SLATT domain-containing protein [Pelagibaculum spongiae]|uniref:DUF4231 domain-containing protein n=1 Tax=Pelagibaculum spongiae TaxID=2080658 RepID=A0A2V1GQE5_9GAMM|nr:SLATT domain-containing protein [Pelagibaculum spongiae]PVZ65418.1 DUF4231 domain-containing protein [Pelagibaculum spongiae]